MERIIKDKLKIIAQEQAIQILYACESGSRAWGFPSPDSDYDVRFIYVQPLDWHLTLFPKKDTIEVPIDADLDLGGWELAKVLQLLWKSNAALLEWIQSPIVYSSNQTFLDELNMLSSQYFSPIAGMHHYLSMCKNYMKNCQGSEIKLKSYFYAFRASLSADWIRIKNRTPHIEIAEMFEVLDQDLVRRVKELIALKATKPESYLHKPEPLLDYYLEDSFYREYPNSSEFI